MVKRRNKWLRERAALTAQVRAFFAGRDFLEVETPLLVPSPGLEPHLAAFEVTSDGPARYLVTSPEYQMKRLLAEGYERIVQVCKCFRKGERGSRHNPEFTMVEWYRGNAGVESVMEDTEGLVRMLTGGSVQLLDDPLTVDTAAPFLRMTVAEAFERYAGVTENRTLELAAADEEAYFRLLVDRIEPAFEGLAQPVFLTDYPATQASLARKKPGDPRYAERFELYVAGVELCNGFGELTDATEQRARLEHDQETRRSTCLPVYPIDELFLSAVAELPPSAGNALGLDRLVALCCGSRTIDAALSFTIDEL
jgi:lysyl-tRNA synthetase class 2